MIEPDAFDELVREVARRNDLDAETAGEVVVAVGDVQMIDRESGKVVAELGGGRRLLIDWPEEGA